MPSTHDHVILITLKQYISIPKKRDLCPKIGLHISSTSVGSTDKSSLLLDSIHVFERVHGVSAWPLAIELQTSDPFYTMYSVNSSLWHSPGEVKAGVCSIRVLDTCPQSQWKSVSTR